MNVRLVARILDKLDRRSRERICSILAKLADMGIISRDFYDRLMDYLAKYEICEVFGIDKRIVNTEDDITSLYGILSDLKDENTNSVSLVREIRNS